ncbi:MAG: hypothetical protein BYD32DRAFT_475242 [Podila humilis]|nr:MAG: hypothetical protein BYD32DRAFT_475242 [Podila humilis]
MGKMDGLSSSGDSWCRVGRRGSASRTLRRRSVEETRRPEHVPIISPDNLKVGDEVGKVPFGTIYMGTYNGEQVYVRETDENIRGIPLDLIGGSVRLSRCLVDYNNVLRVPGICQGRMIVTETTTHGLLSDFPIRNILQKVEIARKVADTIIALYDVVIDKWKKDAGPLKRLQVVPTASRTSTPSVFLMYEISTGREPTDEDDVDLVEIEDMRICAEHTDLMQRCLNGRHLSARPKRDEVVQELLSIEITLMGADREP